MKKITLLILTGSLCFLTGLQARNNSNHDITLDLLSPTNPPLIELNEKGYWTETYNTAETYRWVEFGLFKLSHNLVGFGGTDVGGGMSYWDGFTYCTSGDTRDYGELGNSNDWVAEQWGCMAGGGIKTDAAGNVLTDNQGKVLVEQGNPYLVAYWGYYQETFGDGSPCLQIRFSDEKLYQPVGVYIANHPWPYYGNIHGDGFARPFEEGDYFKLFIHGLNEQGEDVGIAVEHTLAEFKNGELIQSPDWQWVDLSGLGMVSGIYFTMETTDSDPIYGPNTAVYFCLDKLQVQSGEENTAPTRPTGLTAEPTETTIDFSWTASTGAAGVKGYNLYLDNTFETFVETTRYSFTGLQPYTQYQIGIEAVANDDTPSEKALLTVSTTDETPPTVPANLSGSTTQYTMTLSWDASADNVAVTEYHIYLDGERQKKVTGTGYTLTGLDPAKTYLVEVEARDAAGNRSAKTSIFLTTSIISALTIPHIDQQLVRIYDLTGRELSEKNITELPRGTYILKFENQIIKIIKQ